MAETANIAQMAEIISAEIFQEFGWIKVGPMNANWDCLNEEDHGVHTHPSDVVFYYDDPYRNTRIYVQTDLKSYAKKSISKSALIDAINSLAIQLACAEISDEWQGNYVHPDITFDVCGMLFVYNHDGEFDSEFSDLLKGYEDTDNKIPEGSKIFILGPKDVYWLSNVSTEIVKMRGNRGDLQLPGPECCSFFYPQPVQRAFVRTGEVVAASLEVLTGPFIILKYKEQSEASRLGYVLFYKGNGQTVDEFLYLIDYLRQHEILGDRHRVQIKAIDKDGKAENNFQKAKHIYIEQVDATSPSVGLSLLIKDILFSNIRAANPSFSERQIGMQYDR